MHQQLKVLSWARGCLALGSVLHEIPDSTCAGASRSSKAPRWERGSRTRRAAQAHQATAVLTLSWMSLLRSCRYNSPCRANALCLSTTGAQKTFLSPRLPIFPGKFQTTVGVSCKAMLIADFAGLSAGQRRPDKQLNFSSMIRQIFRHTTSAVCKPHPWTMTGSSALTRLKQRSLFCRIGCSGICHAQPLAIGMQRRGIALGVAVHLSTALSFRWIRELFTCTGPYTPILPP